ncbi:MAG: hypothetical protein K9G49_11080 [Taibaiella sp.]|nr:hypothetical protein [Taibaiella sp.]
MQKMTGFSIDSIVKKIVILFLFPAITLLYSCNNSSENVPDTSAIKINLKTHRFDKDLYAIDTNHIGEGLQQLSQKYPDFLNYFLDTIMAYGINGNYNDTVTGIREGLKPFLVFKDFKELADTIQKHYPDTKNIDAQLTDGFKFLKYYFPETPIPKIIYLSMGLSNWHSFPIDTNTLCIGLDMFLGDHYPHYRAIGVHDYMRAHFRRAYIPASVFLSLYRGNYPLVTQEKTLLELMIQKGKEQYFLHKILPGTPDSVLFCFRQQQMDWCNKNEAFVYNFFIQNQLLYNRESQNIMPYVTDGPFARGLETANTPEKLTPGNIGTWMGYRIIETYMSRFPKTTLKELMQLQLPAAQILEQSKYKPR